MGMGQLEKCGHLIGVYKAEIYFVCGGNFQLFQHLKTEYQRLILAKGYSAKDTLE